MALRVTGGKALPAEILDQILERTDGVPLFLEELTRTMLKSGLMTDAGDHYELAGPLPPLAIPANLHNSLMARLDRLATVKELAQIGAVIGREFSHELIAAVADRPQEQLESGLDSSSAQSSCFAVAPRRRDLQFQARPRQGRRLSVVAQVQAPAVARSRRAGIRGAVSGCRRNSTRAARISPDRSRAGRTRGGCMGAGRSRGPRPVGDARGGELALPGRRIAPGNAVLARSTAPRARVARRPRRRSHQYARPGLFRSSGGARARGSVVPGARRPQGPLSRALEPLARLQRAR